MTLTTSCVGRVATVPSSRRAAAGPPACGDARTEHNRTPALQALDEEYKQLSLAFPRASLPYIRRHHIASVQGRAADAIALLGKALELVDSDPYLDPGSSPQFHWLQSFVRRRLIAQTIPEAAIERFELNSPESARSQVERLELAIKSLMEMGAGTFLTVRTRLTLRRRRDGPTTSSFTRAGWWNGAAERHWPRS